MSNKRKYYSAALKAEIAISAIKGKLTHGQLTSEYGVHATQIKTWKQKALDAIKACFSNTHEKERKQHETLLADLYQEIGRLHAQLSWIKKKYMP